MAIDLYSDNSGGGSPRISFSYDLSQSDTVPVEQLLRSFSSSSSVDFNFCIHGNNDQYQHSSPSMADELFYNGKILPTHIKPKTDLNNKRSPTQLLEAEKPRTFSVVAPLEDVVQESKHNNNNKSSFWGFKRSSSCGSGYARSLCPITLLSRSHSTGSTTSTKRSSSSSSSSSSTKELINPKRGFQKGTVSQKPPLRKSGYAHGNGNGNGIRVNPVLNLGFGSFFSSINKNKNKK